MKILRSLLFMFFVIMLLGSAQQLHAIPQETNLIKDLKLSLLSRYKEHYKYRPPDKPSPPEEMKLFPTNPPLPETPETNVSPIKPFMFTLWCTFKAINFQGLSREEQNKKFITVFENLMRFVQRHCIKSIVVFIPDPSETPFFDIENFNEQRVDNFYHWACKLYKHTECIQVFFTADKFQNPSKSIPTLLNQIYNTMNYYFNPSNSFGNFLGLHRPPWGDFQDIDNKLDWVSYANGTFDSKCSKPALIKGMVVAPSKYAEDWQIQNLVNIMDYFKHANHPSACVPPNFCFNFTSAIMVPIEKKDLALVNLAAFPIEKELRPGNNTKIVPPSTFPSKAPYSTPPGWREDCNTAPMLDSVFIRLDDSRLEAEVYQNQQIMPNPRDLNVQGAQTSVQNLARVFKGLPDMQGPGLVSIREGCCHVDGHDTYFQTGRGADKMGRLFEGSWLEVRSPLQPSIRRRVKQTPTNNHYLEVDSPFSMCQDVMRVPYYCAYIPGNWSDMHMSDSIRNKIHLMLDTSWGPNGKFFGNWSKDNFFSFCSISNNRNNELSGLLGESLFQVFDPARPTLEPVEKPPSPRNLSLFEFTTIPEYWNL